MPFTPSFTTVPAGTRTVQLGTTSVPFGSTGTLGIIDFSKQTARGVTLTPAQIAGRMGSLGAPYGVGMSPNYSGAYLSFTNDSDSALAITFQNSGLVAGPIPPGHQFNVPIPPNEEKAAVAVVYTNPVMRHPAATLVVMFYDATDVAAGHLPVEGIINPNVGAGTPGGWFDVMQYGAVGDGVTIDSGAISLALTAAQTAGGGIVYFPPGHRFSIAATITIPADNILLLGGGWSSVIAPTSGVQSMSGDVIATPLPTAPGQSGFIRNYVGVVNLAIDGTGLIPGPAQGQGNGIHFYGTRYSLIDRVLITHSPNWGVLLDGDNTAPGNNFGFDNLVTRCVFDLCAGNIYCTNNEANDFVENRFKWAGGVTAVNQPLFGAGDTVAMHLRLSSGYNYAAGNVFGKGGTYTTPAVRCENSGPCRIIGNRFEQVRNQAIVLNGGNHEFIGNALGSPGSAIAGVPAIQLGSSRNRVVGNSFDTTAGGANYTYCVAESGGPYVDNIVADNHFIAGTAGLVNLNAASTDKVHHNSGYNPVGALAAPAIPASAVAQTNTTGLDVTVYVNGGTVSAVAVGGTPTGQTGGAFRVPAGQTITLTYTVAPTWTWYGD